MNNSHPKRIGSYILYGKVNTAIIFVIFAIVSLNDPDWFIWIPAYGIVTALILITNNKARKLKLITGCFFLVLGLFVFAAVFNDVMFT
ncbi:MAG TPA: hypothetical protein EYQ40_08445 [Candidatus Marinimicrobia bacterium]|nr:hypothetical protein [Candidatus Neomarinimicrobiota bacterium]